MEVNKRCVDCGTDIDEVLIAKAEAMMQQDLSIVKIDLRCKECELKKRVEFIRQYSVVNVIDFRLPVERNL